MHFQTILNNTKHINKSIIYDPLQPWLGNGLLTSGGNVMTFICICEFALFLNFGYWVDNKIKLKH